MMPIVPFRALKLCTVLVSWNAIEPTEKSTDYTNHMSGHLKAIENAVDLCVQRGVKVEFVMWHTPNWASVSQKWCLATQEWIA